MHMYSPKMNSFVILMMNTEIFSGCCPRVSITKISFKMGRASQIPSVVCNIFLSVYRAIR